MLRRRRSNRNSPYLLVRVQNGAATLEHAIEPSPLLPQNPFISLLSVWPKKLNVYSHIKI